jgi:hypothetical protein
MIYGSLARARAAITRIGAHGRQPEEPSATTPPATTTTAPPADSASPFTTPTEGGAADLTTLGPQGS